MGALSLPRNHCQVTLSLLSSVVQAELEPDLELAASSSFRSVGITEVQHAAQIHPWSWQRQRLEFGPLSTLGCDFGQASSLL